METIIRTEDDVRVSIDAWDNGGAWLHLGMRNGSSSAIFTRAEAEKLLAGLQAILGAEVAA